MPDTTARVSRTLIHFHQTTDPEAVVHNTGTLVWCCEFYKAGDLASAELQGGFDQDSVTEAVNRERAIISIIILLLLL